MLTPVWVVFWVDFCGVVGKTALNPASVATYGFGVGVGVGVDALDEPPQPASVRMSPKRSADRKALTYHL